MTHMGQSGACLQRLFAIGRQEHTLLIEFHNYLATATDCEARSGTFPRTEVQDFGDEAVPYSLIKITMKSQGKRESLSCRSTEIFQKRNGQWGNTGARRLGTVVPVAINDHLPFTLQLASRLHNTAGLDIQLREGQPAGSCPWH